MARDGWLRDYEWSIVREIELECVRCGATWFTDVYTEYGKVQLVDANDAYCPECGGDGEE